MLRPNTLVELGTHCGDSYSAFCQATRAFDLQTQCFAVDTWEGDSQAGYYGDEVFRELSEFHDTSYGEFSELLRMRFDQALPLFEEGSVDLLHIDGLHTYEAVREDFETWLPKMSDSGLMLFHDTNVRDRQDFQVWRLWQEVTAERPHFEFKYGFGLGVLGVGNNLPPSILEFFDWAAREPDLVESFFLKQGCDIEVSKLERVLTERDQLVSQLHELGRLNQHAQNVVAARDEQLEAVNNHLRKTGENLAHAMNVVDERDQRLAMLLQQMDSARQNLSSTQSALADKHQSLQLLDDRLQAAQQELVELKLAADDERRAHQAELKRITDSRWWSLRNAIWSFLGAQDRIIPSDRGEKG